MVEGTARGFQVSSRPDASDAQAAFADLPSFDVIDGELLPRDADFEGSGLDAAESAVGLRPAD